MNLTNFDRMNDADYFTHFATQIISCLPRLVMIAFKKEEINKRSPHSYTRHRHSFYKKKFRYPQQPKKQFKKQRNNVRR
jgi:hypothetical protein